MEPVREQILNLQHISYTYHTLQGETRLCLISHFH